MVHELGPHAVGERALQLGHDALVDAVTRAPEPFVRAGSTVRVVVADEIPWPSV